MTTAVVVRGQEFFVDIIWLLSPEQYEEFGRQGGFGAGPGGECVCPNCGAKVPPPCPSCPAAWP